ncbi:MAG: hypothetical protein K2M31_02430 [Muribaculaceae bacterium]|nr:hypothetical protein [Muribaculaceae bacterium]
MSSQERILPPQTAYRRRLSEMLDLTYELEGLLHIGVTRSAVPPRLNQLIVAKLNALVTLADEPAKPEELEEIGFSYPMESAGEEETSGIEESLQVRVDNDSDEIEADINDAEKVDSDASQEDIEESIEKIEDEEDVTEDEIQEDPDEEKEEAKEEILHVEEEEIEDEDYDEKEDLVKEETGIEEQPEDDDNHEEFSAADTTIPELDNIIKGSGYYEPGAYVDPEAYVEVDDDFPKMERPRRVAPKKEVAPRSRGRLFSINDRFLFSREIFGGNLKDFDKCMDEIIMLDSYDEAEEYMMDEWNLDLESKEGISFMAKISKLFK